MRAVGLEVPVAGTADPEGRDPTTGSDNRFLCQAVNREGSPTPPGNTVHDSLPDTLVLNILQTCAGKGFRATLLLELRLRNRLDSAHFLKGTSRADGRSSGCAEAEGCEIAGHLSGARQAFVARNYEGTLLACEKVLLLDPQNVEALDLLDLARTTNEEQRLEVLTRPGRRSIRRTSGKPPT